MSTKPIKLGALARDTITGYTGVVIAITDWLNGCRRITIQSKELKDGKPVDNCTFDLEQLDLVEEVRSKAIPTPKGGPSISPSRARNPK